MEKKIKEFIKNNKLDFTGSDSSLNGNCVILAGYIIYLESLKNDEGEELYKELRHDQIADSVRSESGEHFNTAFSDEFERVYNYAYDNNYESFWKTEEAKKMYKF